jgi:hypothetical protein
MAVKSRPHVFLSHVREDAERIERLASALEARKIKTWIDRHHIKPGQRWQKAIEDAIRSGAFFVACFSKASAVRARSYMNEELQIAIEEIRLRPTEISWFLPIRLDNCEIPDRPIGPGFSMRSLQWLDMFPDWAEGVERLAQTIAPSKTKMPWYPVRLDPILANVEGWPEVAMSIARQMKECGLGHWVFIINPLDEPCDPEEIPYPDFDEAERRIAYKVHVEPVLGRNEVRGMAISLFDLFLQYLEPDEDDLENDRD